MPDLVSEYAPLLADDLNRTLAITQMDGPNAQHLGLVGDKYTITVAGKDTNDRFGVSTSTCRPEVVPDRTVTISKRPSSFWMARWKGPSGERSTPCGAGETINIPSDAPHQPASLEKAAHLHLGERNPHDPQASPLYDDLTDTPPILLHVGQDEIPLEDSRRLAQRIRNSVR